jgi:RNA 3'-terminal phosphate cyclase (ATP)
VRLEAGASRLRRELAERAARAVAATLWEARRLEVESVVLTPESASPGSWLCVEAVFERGRAAFAALGERGLAPETLGDRLARRLLRFIENEDGAVDPLAAELLAVPLAVAGVGARVTTPEVSLALVGSIEVLTAFGLPVEAFGRVGGPGGFEVRPC